MLPGSVNAAVGGWTCKTVRKKISAQLSKHDPRWTLVVCGENDLSDGRSVVATFSSWKSIASKARSNRARAYSSRLLFFSSVLLDCETYYFIKSSHLVCNLHLK